MTIDVKLPINWKHIILGVYMVWLWGGHLLLINSILFEVDQPMIYPIMFFGGFLVVLPIMIGSMVTERSEKVWFYRALYPYWILAKLLKRTGRLIKDQIPYRLHMSDWDDEGKK